MANNAAQIDTAGVALDADRLEVYRVAPEFDAFAVRALPRRGCVASRSSRARQFLHRAQHCGGVTGTAPLPFPS